MRIARAAQEIASYYDDWNAVGMPTLDFSQKFRDALADYIAKVYKELAKIGVNDCYYLGRKSNGGGRWIGDVDFHCSIARRKPNHDCSHPFFVTIGLNLEDPEGSPMTTEIVVIGGMGTELWRSTKGTPETIVSDFRKYISK